MNIYNIAPTFLITIRSTQKCSLTRQALVNKALHYWKSMHHPIYMYYMIKTSGFYDLSWCDHRLTSKEMLEKYRLLLFTPHRLHDLGEINVCISAVWNYIGIECLVMIWFFFRAVLLLRLGSEK